ncbi:MAG TPA: hypothetical protein VGD66_09625 [Allosphingosinicella sp.]|jgi:hypothetical protein
MGRFDWTSVCPAAAGLSPAQNAAVAARMRRVAEALGIRVAAADCKPNALVLVTRDKKALIKGLRRANPIYFQDASGRPVDVPDQPGPATAWHLEGRLDRSGAPVAIDPIGQYYVVNSPTPPSRISASLRPIFLASVLVVEAGALEGLTTTQVADYAAMRAFAGTDPARLAGSAAPTILTVLDAPMDSEVPPTLTQWDLAYLKGLYASAPSHYGRAQSGEVRQHMNKELKQAQDGHE